ncbi:MAG: hypothetical protein IJQ90_02665 [Alphaproteobacteria bacterium]|nr:hypothetical protein [Alphaproteobacteria bacterium]
MKFNNILLFVTIASILSTGAFADSKTITTQGYVDAADALKQDKIAGHTQYYPDSVITDTTNDGVLGKRLTLGSDNWFTPTFLGNRLIAGKLTQNPDAQVQEYIEDGEFTMDDLKKSFIQTNVLEYVVSNLKDRMENIYDSSRMTCAQYIQNAAQTPENCLLWNVPD